MRAVLSLPIADVSSHTKKLTIKASIFIAYCCAMIIGPQVFLTKKALNYLTGYKCLMGFEITAIFLLRIYAIGCKIENKRRNKREGTNVELSLGEMVDDKTDYEKRGFRYILVEL